MVRAVRRIGAALDLRLDWDAGYRGTELQRMRDADHARLSEWLVRRLEALGWTTAVERSFNHYGERGRIDILAYHPSTRTLLVIEVKTIIVEVQHLIGGLDVKQRVASGVARSLGWRPAAIVPMLVLRESTTNRRRLAAHERLLARLALRGKQAVSWLRRPSGSPDGTLLFVKLPDRSGADVRRAGRQRVRLRRTNPSVARHYPGSPQAM